MFFLFSQSLIMKNQKREEKREKGSSLALSLLLRIRPLKASNDFKFFRALAPEKRFAYLSCKAFNVDPGE